MPNIVETEERLRSTFQAVASSVHYGDDSAASTTVTASIELGRRPSRRGPLLVVVGSFLAVLMFGGITMLTVGDQAGDGLPRPVEPGVSSNSTSITAIPPPNEEVNPSTVFWAAILVRSLDSILRWDTYGADDSEPQAEVVERSETGEPFGAGGSIWATAVSVDGQMTVRAEYLGRGEDVDDVTLQAEIAEMTADGITEHVDTIWHSPEADPDSTEQHQARVQAGYFLTELGAGSSRVTVITPLGRLVLDVEVQDPSLLLDRNQQLSVAEAMLATSLDLTWNPDHSLSLEVDQLPQPTTDDWVELDDDLWVALVDEGEHDRLWFKTDVQEAIPAPATDIRTAYVYASGDFVVIVVGQPVPDDLTVNWDDGSSETVEPTWNTEMNMGFARFEDHGAQVLSVDGP